MKEIFLIAYDVKDDKRRNRIARELLLHGIRVQYSIFELLLTQTQLKKLKRNLKIYINPLEDSIIIYKQSKEEYKNIKREGNQFSFGHIYDIFV
ncbi:CRISPR-associated endonuclease Cas2 [Persephonella sp.]